MCSKTLACSRADSRAFIWVRIALHPTPEPKPKKRNGITTWPHHRQAREIKERWGTSTFSPMWLHNLLIGCCRTVQNVGFSEWRGEILVIRQSPCKICGNPTVPQWLDCRVVSFEAKFWCVAIHPARDGMSCETLYTGLGLSSNSIFAVYVQDTHICHPRLQKRQAGFLPTVSPGCVHVPPN